MDEHFKYHVCIVYCKFVRSFVVTGISNCNQESYFVCWIILVLLRSYEMVVVSVIGATCNFVCLIQANTVRTK